MRVLATVMIMGSLVLVGAVPDAAGRSISTNTYIYLADVSPPPEDRDSYMQKVKNEMQAWQQKLHDFGERAQAGGQQAGAAAKDELNAAWTATEVEAHRLQTAGTAGWDSAKISYENASHGLAATWDRLRPADK